MSSRQSLLIWHRSFDRRISKTLYEENFSKGFFKEKIFGIYWKPSYFMNSLLTVAGILHLIHLTLMDIIAVRLLMPRSENWDIPTLFTISQNGECVGYNHNETSMCGNQHKSNIRGESRSCCAIEHYYVVSANSKWWFTALPQETVELSFIIYSFLRAELSDSDQWHDWFGSNNSKIVSDSLLKADKLLH